MRPLFLLLCLWLPLLPGCAQKRQPAVTQQAQPAADSSGWQALTPYERSVIVDKGTERPFSGEYEEHFEKGTYVCKRCRTPLYRSDDKFDAHCGWPSFDAEIKGAVRRQADADGQRTEILCNHCGAHLGHVFLGEGFTAKDTRHCVNSVSLQFVPAPASTGAALDTAILASGCFWGTEYHLQQLKGVKSTTVGYTGGHTPNPTYKQVCADTTGHAEAVQVVFDPKQVSYEQIVKLFFETHDPGQLNRQGPDVGEQYRSAIFYRNLAQKQTAELLISLLRQKGYQVVTEVTPASTFYAAEGYHQDYYQRKGDTPYCHIYRKKF